MGKVDVGVCKLIIGSQSFGNVIWRDAQSQLRALLAERERHLALIKEFLRLRQLAETTDPTEMQEYFDTYAPRKRMLCLPFTLWLCGRETGCGDGEPPTA